MIHGPVVVDASVVVEYLVQLTHTAAATVLFARLAAPDSTVRFYAPDLVYPESASALRKLTLRKAITAREATKAIDRLSRLPIAAAATRGLLAEAWQLRDRVTIYDACYVALARRLEAPFVTADERLAGTFSRSRDRVLFLGSGKL